MIHKNNFNTITVAAIPDLFIKNEIKKFAIDDIIFHANISKKSIYI